MQLPCLSNHKGSISQTPSLICSYSPDFFELHVLFGKYPAHYAWFSRGQSHILQTSHCSKHKVIDVMPTNKFPMNLDNCFSITRLLHTTEILTIIITRKIISSGGASLRSWHQLYSRVLFVKGTQSDIS